MVDRTTFRNDVQWISATIPASDTEPASAVSLGGLRLFAISMPAAVTSTTVTFKVTVDGDERTIYDDANSEDYTATVAASKVTPLKPEMFALFDSVTPVMGSAEAAERTIKLGVRPL